jgi:hypothetical protein
MPRRRRRFGPPARLLRRLLLALCVLAPAAGAQLHVAVRVSPVADLAHQMDCVGGVIQTCGAEDYRQLWRARFLRDAADSAALDAWRALRTRYAAEVEVDTASRDLVGRQQRRVALGERWRVAALQARTFDDYHERLALLLLTPDRARAVGAMAHFRPRFVAWWDAEARQRLSLARDSLDVLLAGGELRALLDGARRFYGATGAGSDSVTLTLVARPGLVRGGTSAQALEGWAVQEMLPGAAPERVVAVTLHEVATCSSCSRPTARGRPSPPSWRAAGSRRGPCARCSTRGWPPPSATAWWSARCGRRRGGRRTRSARCRSTTTR